MKIKKDFAIFALTFLAVLASRYYFRSFGYDQYDVVDYLRSLKELTFYRPAPWPVLLLIQRFLLPIVGPQQALVIPSVFFGSLFVALVYPIGTLLTKNRLLSAAATLIIAANPVVWIYSEIGMTDIVQACFAEIILLLLLIGVRKRNKRYINYAFLQLGLTLGVKTVHLIALPVILFAQYLVVGGENPKISFRSIAEYLRKNRKTIIKSCGWLLAGIVVWKIPSMLLFKRPEGGSDLEFFLYQLKNFGILGTDWKTKLTLILSYFGYRKEYLYFLNYLLLAYLYLEAIFIYTRRRREQALKLATCSLSGVMLWTVSFFCLRISSIAFPPYILLLFGIPLGVFAIQQMREIFKGRKLSIPLPSEFKLTAAYILVYFLFFFTFAGSVSRYFLPTFPPLTVLFLSPLFTITQGENNSLIKSIKAALLTPIVSLIFVMNFQPAITLAESFHRNLDTRTAVVYFLQELSTEKQNGIVLLDLTPFGIAVHKYRELINLDRISVYTEISSTMLSEAEKQKKNIFVLTYGEKEFPDCTGQNLRLARKFQRAEGVIEDSVGNVGFNLYTLDYKSENQQCLDSLKQN